MKYKILPRLFVFLSMLLGVFNINSCLNPAAVEKSDTFGFYYLANSGINYQRAANLPLNTLVLEQEPFLTPAQIDNVTVLYSDDSDMRYNQIVLKEPVNESFSDVVRPFVCVLNGERYFLGEYWPAFTNIIPKSVLLYPMGIDIQLNAGDEAGIIKLNDPIFHNTLEKAGIKVQYQNISSINGNI